MNSSTAKGPRNRTCFVTEDNAGAEPHPGQEVHGLPQGFSEQAAEKEKSTGATSAPSGSIVPGTEGPVRPAQGNSLGVMGSFRTLSVLVVMGASARINIQSVKPKRGNFPAHM